MEEKEEDFYEEANREVDDEGKKDKNRNIKGIVWVLSKCLGG